MAQAIPSFSNNDQLGLSFFASMLIHLVVILGVTFTIPKARELYGLSTLEITLVQGESEQAPEDPEFLAQANQAGGGSSEAEERASNPLPVREAGEPKHKVPALQPPSRPKVVAPPKRSEVVTQKVAEKAVAAPKPQPERIEPQPVPENIGLTQRPAIQQERTRLIAEIDRVWNEYQKRPKHRYLNARTREYKYAAYMKAWEAKVERIGNLNYPDEARRRGLSGQLRLDVALNPDGSVNTITVRKSSGHAVLDDAARRIVQLAAPFPPFPQNIREETDILHITRTWRFNEGGLTSRN
ncbi:MAG: TonB family protein [Acidiferrobacterales bacterium]